MIVLGLSPLDKDATVTLMVDGRVVYAIAEERLSRQKMHAGFPYRALESVLARSGVKPAEVDRVVYAFLDWPREAALMRKNLWPDFRLNRRTPRAKMSRLIREALAKVRERDFPVHGLSSAMERMQKGRLKSLAYRIASADGLVGDLWNHRQFRHWIKQAIATHRGYHEELDKGLREFGLAGKLAKV